ncbi:MAG: YdeI/OmpD-associated family protein [Bacteroidota bacterium]
MHIFKANIDIIGINPFVFVPENILIDIFKQAGKDKGKIPIRGTINEFPYQQTLVKYSGDWRFYINTFMLKNSPKRIGETIELTIEFDPSDRTIEPHPKLAKALDEDNQAKTVFNSLRPSLQLEIVRYIAKLKSEESIDKNITKAIDFLLGNGRFVGRDNP